MPLIARPKFLPESVYRKIETDAAPEVIRNELLSACDTATSLDQVASLYDAFCNGRELCGPRATLAPDEVLGHVKPEERTVRRIANELSMNPSAVADIFMALAGERSDADSDEAQIWFEEEIVNADASRRLEISRRPAWLFRTVDGADPFASELRCLPWQLALPFLARTPATPAPTTRVACLGYRIPAKDVSFPMLPTVIDAWFEGVTIYWVPGGKTVPHSYAPPKCVAAGGLD
jgi:hypothetical protein